MSHVYCPECGFQNQEAAIVEARRCSEHCEARPLPFAEGADAAIDPVRGEVDLRQQRGVGPATCLAKCLGDCESRIERFRGLLLDEFDGGMRVAFDLA